MDVLCTDKLINYVVLELNKNNNREKIDSMIIDPVISHIMLKIHPYLIIMSLIFTVLFVLMFAVLFIVIKDKINT
jgi:hypothetical protein|tara:strand:+ start:3382 stop:3606 length:225 start_codon:yes stop_codon:yes gene_type:complete